MNFPLPASECGLPHRAPFLFLDEIVGLEPGVSAEATLCLPASTPFFTGHFPGNPVVPGVILAEAIAQLAGVAAAREGRGFLLSAVRSMKFPSAAGPEEQIWLEARVVADHGALVQCEGRARVEERIVAEGLVVLSQTRGGGQ
jgi:3-hydroxyacyl-[acyl-carrier-protein] dehydratase